MAKFNVNFCGDANGIDEWKIELERNNDTPNLGVEEKHSLSIVKAAFKAIRSYEIEQKDEQNILLNSGSSSNTS